ncbi:MAG: TolC family protein [Planctomycetes bacterium]|nr:TolC family protein [Planctomycetota bacterium]
MDADPTLRTVPPIRTRLFSLAYACSFLTILGLGCVTVDPQQDYEQAGKIIAERTGVEHIYDPAAEELAQSKIEQLLVDGLTVDEAVQVALLNNRGFQTVFNEIGVSRAEVVQSGLVSNPSLGLSLRFPEGGGRSNLTLTFAQQLVDLWQIPVRKRIAQAQLERTILTVARQAVTLAAEVETLYYRLVALLQAAKLTAEDLKLAERLLALARGRFEAGDTGKLDVNLARASVFNVRQQAIILRGGVRAARSDLARALGLARWDRPWTLADEFPTGPTAPQNEAVLLDLAMRQRLDVQAAAMQVRAAEDNIRRQILEIFPNVTLGVEYERLERRALPGRNIPADTARASARSGQLTAPDIQTRGERRIQRRQIIDSLLGPTLDITLPIWHQNQAQIAKARFAATQRRKEFEDLLDVVAQDVQKAAAAADSAAELATFFHDQSLPLARENVEAARRAYQAGQQSIIALMNAQKTLIAQRAEYVNAQRDSATALASLRRAVGGKLPPTETNEPAVTPPAPSAEENQ